MNPLTCNWAIAMILGWALLIAGWTTTNHVLIGAALFIFLVSSIERYENLRIERNRRDQP